ncbi:regulator of (H+)-ATPase in vacuolar membrane [Ascosphaera aggregata]|nr:regulator of (H+)-ATPase in vacuolar membrane [Ascosphaera aggregata]
MQAILPGRPPPKLQAFGTALCDGLRIVVYITGRALVILASPRRLLQTIYVDEVDALDTVALDEYTGQIAVTSESCIFVYQPFNIGNSLKVGNLLSKGGRVRLREEKCKKHEAEWSQYQSFSDTNNDPIKTLCWGTSHELLASTSSHLLLWNTAFEPRITFKTQLANPVKFANFSPDGQFIASSGDYDCLVKIWHRCTFDSEKTAFEVSYLRHEGIVAHVHWRRPCFHNDSMGNVLYTICSDDKLRIYTDTELRGNKKAVLKCSTSIDMARAIQPRYRDDGELAKRRYALILDCREFATAVDGCEKRGHSARQQNALEHIVEIAKRSPDLCVIFDGRGHMSVWGVSQDTTATPTTRTAAASSNRPIEVFNVSHVEGVDISLIANLTLQEDYAQFLAFAGGNGRKVGQVKDRIVILTHHFDGRIEWLESEADILFDPSHRSKRLRSKASWSGHQGTLKKIVRDVSGKTLVSRTDDNKATIWHQEGSSLIRQSTLLSDAHIHRSCLLDKGNLLANLHHDCVILWDVGSFHAKELARCDFQFGSKPSCILQLPTTDPGSNTLHIAAVAANMSGIAWEVKLDQPTSTPDEKQTSASNHPAVMTEFSRFQVEDEEDFAYMLPVDPAGSRITITGFFDIFAADIAISYTNGGTLKTWTAKVDEAGSEVHWLRTSTIETGITNPSLASATSIRKAAVADQDRSRLTIWDTKNAQLEFEERFESHDTIRDLDWTSTPDNQSILAVGFPQKVVLMSQLRYDYLGENPSWAHIHEIRIRDMTPHPIGDSCWLGSGGLVVGAGNQLFIYDKDIPAEEPLISRLRLAPHKGGKRGLADVFDVVSRLNGPLPVFHPQFLSQSILSGKIDLVHLILTTLNQKLKYFTEGDELDSFLGIPPEVIYDHVDAPQQFTWRETQLSPSIFADEELHPVDAAVAASLRENLAKITLPQLTSGEQLRLVDIAECVSMVEKHRRSMDGNAARFVLFFRDYMMRKGQGLDSPQESIPWRDIVWAFHSGSQEILTDLVSMAYNNKMMWEQARECGLFMWLRDLNALRAQLEIVARNEYTSTEDRNPVNCSLFYFALRKKNIIQGLWRMAHWHKEQKPTQKLLSQNFNLPRWKTASLKNAYALLGKRRFHYAAAFFLLADSPRDAAHVCINQLKDPQLAIAIVRAYEGDDGPVLKNILEKKILPQATLEGNRWMATWAFWLLQRRDLAVQCLIVSQQKHESESLSTILSANSLFLQSPVESLTAPIIDTPTTADAIPLQAKSYLSNDPALSVIYQQLREKTLQTIKGVEKIPAKEEWDFIIRNARLYARMGCDLLALNLVKHWRFITPALLPPSQQLHRKLSEEADLRNDVRQQHRRHVLRRRGSLTVADMSPPDCGKKNKEETEKSSSKTPTMFMEPDAMSLLDSFGF